MLPRAMHLCTGVYNAFKCVDCILRWSYTAGPALLAGQPVGRNAELAGLFMSEHAWLFNPGRCDLAAGIILVASLSA
jgi:hypothetical protein